MSDTSSLLTNSVWPNGLKEDSEGYAVFYPLGTNKVDVSAITWPTGDKLISPFVYQDDKLVGFVDTKALIVSDNTTIYLPFEHIEAEFSEIYKGQLQIHAPNATTKKASWKDSGKEDIPEAQFKYKDCTTVKNIETVDANYQTTDIVDGVWSEPLWDLTSGVQMFDWCSELVSFSSDLPKLSIATLMFRYCYNLTTFTSDLSSLTYGANMFNGCSELTSFNSDLSSLTLGGSMFQNCSQLTSFSSDLPNLTTGGSMFSRCKLDAESVMHIADTIKNITAEKQLYINGTIPYVTELSWGVYSAPRGFMSDGDYVYTYNNPQSNTATISSTNVGEFTLGINVSNNAETIQQQLEDFAKEANFDSWADLKQLFVDKGWTVTFQYGGSSTSITYGLRGGEQIIPCPIFAKLVQVEDKDSAEYCTEDGSAFYNINWGHDVTDTSSYTQFNSLEDAMTSWNVFPKENIITTEE